ncbi:MAG: hypothetical protein KQ78_01317 [Candidatus Izimaplasma bacterium HR2]|nr:MAG: hypothetical protein KQ78_01317 [Candidatus Izimaplasma bacterium HR2]
MPDNIKPEHSIYYATSLLLENIWENPDILAMDYVQSYYAYNLTGKISFNLYILCIDYLYLLGIIKIRIEGGLEICI